MRIGIDGQIFKKQKTGIGRYVWELSKQLDKQMPNAMFYIYSNEPVPLPVFSDRWISRIDPLSYANHIKFWLKFRCGAMVKEDQLDVFWGAASFFPHLSPRVRKVISVYDFNCKIVPKTMKLSNLIQFKLFFKNEVLSSDSVLAISQGTADKISYYFGRKADAIVYPAVSKEFVPQDDVRKIQQCLNKYKISCPYLLTVATWEPRKNIELLLKSFIKLKADGYLSNYNLVLAGKQGWKNKRIQELINNSIISGVQPLGYVPDDDLPVLYSCAEAFVFPSIYEGFGMPVLEARACGTRVVASDITELREAGGVDGIYLTPSEEGIRAGLLKVVNTPHIRSNRDLNWQTWEQGAQILASNLRGNV